MQNFFRDNLYKDFIPKNSWTIYLKISCRSGIVCSNLLTGKRLIISVYESVNFIRMLLAASKQICFFLSTVYFFLFQFSIVQNLFVRFIETEVPSGFFNSRWCICFNWEKCFYKFLLAFWLDRLKISLRILKVTKFVVWTNLHRGLAPLSLRYCSTKTIDKQLCTFLKMLVRIWNRKKKQLNSSIENVYYISWFENDRSGTEMACLLGLAVGKDLNLFAKQQGMA